MRLTTKPVLPSSWVICLTVFLAGVLSVPAFGDSIVDLGGTYHSMTTDPQASWIYARLDTDEVVAVAMGATSVAHRVTIAGDPGPLAVSDDGSLLFVGLLDTDDIAVYSAPDLAYIDTIETSSMTSIWGLVAGPNRLYAVFSFGFSIIDTTTREEINYFHESSLLGMSDLEILSDNSTIVGDMGTYTYMLDVSDDTLEIIARGDCRVYNVSQIAVSPNEDRLYVAHGAPYYIEVLELPVSGQCVHTHNLISWAYPSSIALSPDGGTAYVGRQSTLVVVFDTQTLLPYKEIPLQNHSRPAGIAVSSSGQTLAVITGTTPTSYVEFITLSGSDPTLGGVKFRPVDNLDGSPVPEVYCNHNSSQSAISEYIDYENGVFGIAPLEAGIYTADCNVSGYDETPIEFTVTNGSWTDLGTVTMTRTGDPVDPRPVCTAPALIGDQTTTAIMHGDFFRTDIVVESGSPNVSIDSYTWLSPFRVEVVATVGHFTTPTLLEYAFQMSQTGSSSFSGSAFIIPAEESSIELTEPSTAVSEPSGSIAIEVSRSGPTTAQVTIDFLTIDGTATAGDDYTAVADTLTWPAGNSDPKTITVPILEDALPEGPETFTVELLNPTGGAVLGTIDTTEVTIEDDDSSTVRFTAATTGALETAGTVSLTVSRFGDTSAAGSVNWSTADGTAVASSDYTSDGGTLDWAAGNGDDKTVVIDILDDALHEDTEAFTVVLSSPGGNAFLGEPSTATVNIADDDDIEIVFSTVDYSADEGDGNATITAWRTGASNGTVTVDYASADGTATDGSDYTAVNGTLSWPDGDATPKTFDVPITDDSNIEPAETVLLALSNPTGGATIGTPGTAVLTIEDNDGTLLQFTSASFNVDETGGSAVISIERFGSDTSGAVTVGFATVDGIAIDGRDYVATSGTLSWADGETADQSFSVTILDDSLLEGPETLTLTLSNPTGNAGLGTPATADLTIGDDDAGETLINTETSGPQTRPDTAIAPDGSSVVVWESYLQDGAGWGIFGQRFDPAGSPAGPEFQVNSTTGGDQRYAAVAMAPGGAFTVVWHGSDASGDGICGRRFNSAGAPLGAEYVVNTTTAGDQIEPDVAVDGTGAALVVWQSDQTGNLEIRGRAYTSAGAATGNEFAVNTTTANDQQLPSVAGSAGGGFVVAWQSYGQDGPAEGIFARRVSSSGSPAGAEAMVNQWTSGNQIAPSVGQTAAGSFLVAWEDTGHQDGMGSSIRARWFSATAVPQGGDIQVNTHWMNNQTQPGVASDGAGSVTIVWESEDQDGSDLGIYSRTMDGSGAFISPEIRFNSFVTGIQNRPAVARVDTGAYWVVWASGGQDGSGDGIFGVFGAAPPTPEVFADGFESGDTSAWSSSSP